MTYQCIIKENTYGEGYKTMALIKCPECGKEISDKASSCPGCGYPIKQGTLDSSILKSEEASSDTPDENNKESISDQITEKSKMHLKQVKPVHVIISFICVVIIGAVIAFIRINGQYNDAVQAYESGNYEDAYNYFKNSSYKDSEVYYKQSLVQYTYQLIDNRYFEVADSYMQMIKDDTVRKEVEDKMTYVRAIDAYEIGAFKVAMDLFESIPKYEDADKYHLRSETMDNVQGEWMLHGREIYANPNETERNFAAIKINGWDATLYYCTDGKVIFEKVKECKLIFFDKDGLTFKKDEIEYSIRYRVNKIAVEIIKDVHFEELKKSNNPYYVLRNYDKNTLAFEKYESGIPEIPSIGMTSEEVINSTWGNPEDINKDTYSWGVKEQWCYSNYRYIYFEDGIVTAISE